jgi:hypothetical protein
LNDRQDSFRQAEAYLGKVASVESLFLALPIFREGFLLTPDFFPLKTKKYLHRHTVLGIHTRGTFVRGVPGDFDILALLLWINALGPNLYS